MNDTDAARRIVVGITGASGAVYARRTLQLLARGGVAVHLVVSPLGQRLLHDELGIEGGLSEAALRDLLTGGVDALSPAEADDALPGVTVHNYRDVGASIASGSFRHDGMIVVPCSSNSLSAIATGAAQNLLHRAAYVTLKERRRLVLVHRETPLTSIDLTNMQAATAAGAIVAPANPGFYLLPSTIEELVDYVVARGLDLLDIDHGRDVRWGVAVAGAGKVAPRAGNQA